MSSEGGGVHNGNAHPMMQLQLTMNSLQAM